MKIVFKRNVETQVQQWSLSENRKPLLLKGARQVGKTFLMKTFGAAHFKKVAYFNFDEKPELSQFFETTKDVNRILDNLSIIHGEKIQADTLLILDEIQECFPALNALKYFNENRPEIAIICAGSLLGITLGTANSFPVGKVQFLTVYPLTFSEFLEQCDGSMHQYLKSMKSIAPIPDLFFNTLKEHFKKYLITGGLPEVARSFLENSDFSKTETILKDLIHSYEHDFAKHSIMKDIAKIGYVWNSMPSQLGRENKKFIYQLVKPGARAREYEDALLWLEQAGLIYRVSLCKVPKLPLSAYDDLSSYKMYLFDVGILRKQSQLDPIAFSEGNRLFVEFKGALLENYILQSLLPQLEVVPRYWTSGNKAEVDFLIQYKNFIIPVEVKADQNVQSRSLTFYGAKFNTKWGIKYSLKNLFLQGGIINIPHFLADYTIDFLDSVPDFGKTEE